MENISDLFRLATLLLLSGVIIEMVLLISHYVHSIMPMRKEVRSGRLLAPPPGWTLAYHVLVTLWLVQTCVGLGQRISQEGIKSTWATFTAPFLALALIIVVWKFQRYYSANLRRAITKQRQEYLG